MHAARGTSFRGREPSQIAGDGGDISADVAESGRGKTRRMKRVWLDSGVEQEQQPTQPRCHVRDRHPVVDLVGERFLPPGIQRNTARSASLVLSGFLRDAGLGPLQVLSRDVFAVLIAGLPVDGDSAFVGGHRLAGPPRLVQRPP
jgi:hypothetical protein